MTNSWICCVLTVVIAILITISSTNADKDAQRINGPIITPHQKELTLEKGQNYTLTCTGTRELTFRHQESPEEITGLFTELNKTHRISEGVYEHTLELYNINQFAIGYYGCYDKTFQDDLLEKLTEEPNNTAHASFIYIYVNGTDSLFAPMREVILPRCESKVAIECRPTTPDIEVTLVSDFADLLFQQYSPKSGFIIDSASVGLDVPVGIYTCLFNDQKLKKQSERFVFVNKRIAPPPQPTVSPKSKKYLTGESFTFNCTVPYKSNSLINLRWNYPPTISYVNVSNITNHNNVKDGSYLYHSITIVNATRDHAGNYTCQSVNNCESKDSISTAVFLENAYLNLLLGNHLHPGQSYLETKQKTQKITVEMDAYPAPDFYFLRDSQPLEKSSKYKVERTGTGDAKLTISDLNVYDTANYTLIADNRYLTKNLTIDLRKFAPPSIIFDKSVKRVPENALVSLMCEVIGYPLPKVTWSFQNDGQKQVLPSTSTRWKSVYNLVAYLDIPQIHTSGEITCSATNEQGNNSSSRTVLVNEIDDGFGIMNKETTQFYQSQDVTISCYASKYDFYNVTWLLKDEEANGTNVRIEYSVSPFSYIAKLRIPNITTDQGGLYVCHGVRLDEKEDKDEININVEELIAPKIEPASDLSLEVYPYQPVQLNCLVEGVPTPDVQWYKDKEILKNDSNIKIFTNTYWAAVNSTVMIDNTVDDKYRGSYECVAESISGRQTQLYTIASKAGQKLTTMLSVIIVIIFALILLVLYLTCRIRKEKKFRRELQAAGLLYFNEGVTKSLNPELGIDEQAELLPYDDRFEFPPEKLILGKQLGAGAFGVVYKAEARGIINAEESTEVAVKMVKKNADNMYIKALASELKIMVHLGKHINIVNLLGACTKNVGKRELLVIVEYCKFGNIHNYMQKHREVFIDQLTNNVEKNMGRVNRGFSSSGGSTGVHSDYFGSSTQNTDNTFLNSENTNRSTRKGKPKQTLELVRVSEGYVQPEWRSNYESDYSFDGRNPRPLTSRDLLVWAFQIARGMEYLASRKVLHGDLAARNVLLAEDNIVKICDFGLARSIYKNDEYQKKENGLLPVKWLALECMTDRIFSTQSDVWAFGIVLWELFSLAKTPYPNITPATLIQWLSEGNRLHKPAYADERLYNLMMRCWHQKPTLRPTFTELQEILGGFLEDNVRNHYVDLNSAYMELNDKPVGQEDYLTMMCAPDYNNLVTPSPHHYINGAQSFFPATTAPVDEQGYLQMSPASRQNIFSPRTLDTQFDFEAHKFIPKMSEASNCGSELTPMLTLNNLPARSGSDSDHEGNTSPYLHMCPRIDEETDEVFEVKQKNAMNAQNTAITNPTYITLEVDVEKPKDINSSYINVPNGLVK